MIRHALWQAVVAAAGIALVFAILFRLASTQEEARAEVPTAGGAYVEGVVGFPSVVNPILAWRSVGANPIDQDLSNLVFDGLTSLDASGQVTATLASDWEVSEDGTTYEFRLRRDVTWQDGAPFTAADVAFTIQAIQDPDFQGDIALHNLWRTVQVETPDDRTVRFTLKEVFPSFLYYTTIGLLPSHLLGSVPAADLPTSEFSTAEPVGTGQFMVESLTAEGASLAANPKYWGRKPYMDRLEFRFFPDQDALLAGYERGQADGFQVPRGQSTAALSQLPDLDLYSAESAGMGLVFLNLKRDTLPFLQVRDVRQALLYGLDRQAVIDSVQGGQGLVADSPVASMSWAHDPNVKRYSYDPERAIGLLDASGWVDSDGDRIRDKDGVAMVFELLTADDPTMAQMAEEIAGQWRALGVSATVRPVAASEVPALIQGRSFDAVLTEIGLTADPDPYALWHSTQASEGGQNFSGFANEEADLVMERIRTTVDPEKLPALYDRFQQIFAEQVPSLPLFYPVFTYAAGPRVRGIQLSPLFQPSDRFRNLADWYVETAEIVITDQEQLDKTEQ